jgi:hypothetical protein
MANEFTALANLSVRAGRRRFGMSSEAGAEKAKR